MYATATTTVSILRGATTDSFGDPVDNTTPAASGIPASILEQAPVNTTRRDDQPRTVRIYAGRFPAGTDLRDDDRVRDDTGTVYIVDAVRVPTSPVLTPDVAAVLRRVT